MSPFRPTPMAIGARIAFAAALAATLATTLGPPGDAIPFNDKVAHAAAFALLAALARLGFPARPWWIAALALAALGAAIELAQGLPAIARDADILDWFADLIGTVMGLAAARAIEFATQRHQP